MTTETTTEWHEANSLYLTARLSVVRQRLLALCESNEAAADAATEAAASPDTPSRADSAREHELALRVIERGAEEAAAAMTSPPALAELTSAFGLSKFERDVLLLCAGAELDPDFPRFIGAAQGDMQRTNPTFNLARAALPGAHWSALTPVAPLRRWRLIELGSGETMTSALLRIDERILHFLVGASYLDERLQSFVEPVPLPATLPWSHRALVQRVVELWPPDADVRPVIQLTGDASGGKRMLAAAACAALKLNLHVLNTASLPTTPAERETLARLWQRESVLSRSALLIEGEPAADPVSTRIAQSFAASVKTPLLVNGAWLEAGSNLEVASVLVNRPSADEQKALWQATLGPAAERLNGQLDALVSQFNLDVDGIAQAGRLARKQAETADEPAPVIWEICRAQMRLPLDSLAERIETNARWNDLILPEEQYQTLGEIVAHVRQRLTVYQSWGFAARGMRGLGISALFAGPSGTGKTLGAEVLARELGLDLYRIDLSQVVSKYIGETEKNLRRVFDAAEFGGAVLLFDEADALFGKRSEVKDSHDRYANIEVSYLLQRMEAYRGLAILTSNRRNALDAAFLRRIRFVVSFPFPDLSHRSRIWRRMFPAETPIDSLDFDKLARLNVTGGNIRNIAMNAAFLAADAGEPVRMTHLLRTARSECAKIEKQVSAAEIGAWV